MHARDDSAAVDVVGAFERATNDLDVEVVSTSAHRHRGSIELRIVIDKPGGVDIDTCERVSRKLGAALEGYADPFTLSVESAGLDRPLVRPADYERFIGANVKLTTEITVRGAKTHRGRLDGLRGTNVILTQPGGELPIPLSLIKHANLEYDPRADLTKEKRERRHKQGGHKHEH